MQYNDLPLDHVIDPETGEVTTPPTVAGTWANIQADITYNRNCLLTGGDGTDVMHVLVAKFMVLARNRSGGWVGPLADLGDADPSGVGVIMNILYTMLQNDSTTQTVFCADSPEAAQMVDVLTAATQSLLPGREAEVQAVVDALTGGKRWAGVTEADVQAAFDAEAQRLIDLAAQQAAQQAAHQAAEEAAAQAKLEREALEARTNWAESAHRSVLNQITYESTEAEIVALFTAELSTIWGT